jgi:hypothetical protein
MSLREAELAHSHRAQRSQAKQQSRKRKYKHKHKQNKHRSALDAPLSTVLDTQVLTLFEWAQLARISMRTARRLIARGDGPVVTMLSAKRVGVSIGAHKRWLASRERG